MTGLKRPVTFFKGFFDLVHSDSEVSHRLFYSIVLPPLVMEKLSDVMARLKKGAEFADARPAWVPIENLHITLLYLGKTTPDEAEKARTVLADLSLQDCAFPARLQFEGLEIFPSLKNPLVVSVMFQDRAKALTRVHKALAERCGDLGLEFDNRDFRPHLTLARTKSLRTAQRLHKLLESHKKYVQFEAEIDSVGLLDSRLSESGASYNVLELQKL